MFSWFPHQVDDVADWHVDPFDPAHRIDLTLDWVGALEALNGADPKTFWELSRFYWVPQFALAMRDGDETFGANLEAWLADWIKQNPPHMGINWACGQEAAIRVMSRP